MTNFHGDEKITNRQNKNYDFFYVWELSINNTIEQTNTEKEFELKISIKMSFVEQRDNESSVGNALHIVIHKATSQFHFRKRC